MTTPEQSTANTLQYGMAPKKPGLYLGLFHGRNDPCEKMDDWGFNGPVIGPLVWCHTTYASDIKIEFEQAEDAWRYFGSDDRDQEIETFQDMLKFDGKYYGDWTVYYVPAEDCCGPADTFRPNRRAAFRWAHNPMPK